MYVPIYGNLWAVMSCMMLFCGVGVYVHAKGNSA